MLYLTKLLLLFYLTFVCSRLWYLTVQSNKINLLFPGIITVGNDISQLMISMVLSYYAGKGHRPRWIAAGIYTVVLFCLMNALPHFLYGAGEDALYLTAEYSDEEDNTTHHGSYGMTTVFLIL